MTGCRVSSQWVARLPHIDGAMPTNGREYTPECARAICLTSPPCSDARSALARTLGAGVVCGHVCGARARVRGPGNVWGRARTGCTDVVGVETWGRWRPRWVGMLWACHVL